MLAFALGAGAVINGLSARRVMIWADLARAFISAGVVVAAFTVGLSLPLLIAAGVLLAGIQAIFDPALQAVVPRLMPDPHRLRALNGLFDVTGRLAVIAGSGLGALPPQVLPAGANTQAIGQMRGGVGAAVYGRPVAIGARALDVLVVLLRRGGARERM